MIWKKVVLAFGVFLIILWTISMKVEGRRMRFVSTNSKCGLSYLSNCNSWIDNGTFNLNMTSKRRLGYGFRSLVEIQIKLQGSNQYQTLLSYDFDLCKLINESFKNGILRMWFKNIIKYGNFMENCPILPGYYYINKLILEPSSIPVYLQPGSYRLNTKSYFGKHDTKKERMVLQIVSEVNFY